MEDSFDVTPYLHLPPSELLATKWLTTYQIRKLEKVMGFQSHRGKYTNTEKDKIREAISQYQTQHALSDAEILEFLSQSQGRKPENSRFWSSLARSLELRTLVSISDASVVLYTPDERSWTTADIALLRTLHEKLGNKWTQIGGVLSRSHKTCSNRWRSYEGIQGVQHRGLWTEKEDEKLREVVVAKPGITWAAVGEQIRRPGSQCRQRWCVVRSNIRISSSFSPFLSEKGQKCRVCVTKTPCPC